MTKVLYIAPEYPGSGTTAAQVRANALLPRLAQRVDLRIVAFPPHEGSQGADSIDGTIRVDRRKMTPAEMMLGTFSRHPRAFRRFNSQATFQTLSRMLEEFRPDVVHFDSVGTLALMDAVTTLPDRPLIVAQTHDAVSQLYKSRIKIAGRLRKLDTWLEYRKILRTEKTILRKTDLVIVDSDEDATFLNRKSGGTRVVTLPLGFDPEVFSPSGDKAQIKEPAIVFSGAMSGKQSIDAARYLISEIMPEVWKTRPDCNLYMVGNKPTPEIQAMKTNRVHITGFVEDLGSYLRAADLYVCPLRVGSGMRTRVVEALACGAVIIATPFAMRGIGGDFNGQPPWYTARNAAGFSDWITENLTGDHTEVKNRAANFARGHYSWDSVADQMVKTYQEFGT